MRKEMQHLAVESEGNGNIQISQALGPADIDDPSIIVLSPDQVPLLSAWLLEAAGQMQRQDFPEGEGKIPVGFWASNPEIEHRNLDVFANAEGMVILSIDEDHYLQVSPAMAKRLRDKLSKAITAALTDMLRPDSEI